jgi:hypothetical protein
MSRLTDATDVTAWIVAVAFINRLRLIRMAVVRR